MHGILHDVFPPTKEDDDPTSDKELKKWDGSCALANNVLDFDFDGDERTILLDANKWYDELLSPHLESGQG